MPRRKAGGGKAKGDKSGSMAFLLDYMKSHPKAVYGEAQEAAARSGHKIFPIMWGRAQVMLGRVKARARGTAKAAPRKARVSAGAPRRAPPRAVRPSSSGVPLPVGSAGDLSDWQTLVERLNTGAKVALQYDGANWLLVSV